MGIIHTALAALIGWELLSAFFEWRGAADVMQIRAFERLGIALVLGWLFAALPGSL